jgi:hypothetical protein
MHAFRLFFKLGNPLVGFRVAPQPHCAPHEPALCRRPIFVEQLLDARQACRSLGARIIITRSAYR